MTYWKGKQRYDLNRGLSEQLEVMTAFAESNGYEWTPASMRQDVHGKFDGILSAYGNDYRIQYKGLIKGSPKGTVLFEYSNVQGKRGWGRADCDFIFQRVAEDKAVTYSRDRTLDLLHQTLGKPPEDVTRANGGKKPILKWTGRLDRKDVFIYIPIDLLIRHSQAMWRNL